MRSKYRRGLDMVDKLRRGYMNIGLLLLVIAAVLLVPGASATPGYATQTGYACARCHVNPNGGGTLTATGDAFVANGHKIPTVTTTPLSIKVPTAVKAVSTGTDTVVNLGTATASGGSSPYVIKSDAPTAGFKVGTTTVTWTVTDSKGTIATGTQKVTVTKVTSVPTVPTVPAVPTVPTVPEPLVITVPANITNVTTGEFTIVDIGMATTTGGVKPINITNDAPASGFTIGNTAVIWTAIDKLGATATGTQKVTILESVPDVPVPKVSKNMIQGKVFDDDNKNKELDGSEVGLAGMPIKLTGTGETTKGIHRRTITDENGNYKFSDLPPGRYVVHSKFKSRWVSTTRVTKVILNLQIGNIVTANFGKTEYQSPDVEIQTSRIKHSSQKLNENTKIEKEKTEKEKTEKEKTEKEKTEKED